VRVLGVDVGTRRVGLALSDPSATLATPLRALEVSGPPENSAAAVAREIAALKAEGDGLHAVVVGVPRFLDGQPHRQTETVLRFVALLRSKAAVPVELQDERLSSWEAESRLAVREKDWRKRKARLDAASAAVILQDYLDSGRTPETGDGGQED